MAKKRSRLTLHRDEALWATRNLIGGPSGRSKLVYVLITDKRLHYEKGRSRIVYIGTTKNGTFRIAQSVAAKAGDILTLRGVFSFHARIVTCRPRQRVKTWLQLERALLLEFRQRFGEVPRFNTHGRRMREGKEFAYFSRAGVRRVIDELS